MDITKASGKKEEFDENKLRQSIRRAGADFGLAKRICKSVVESVTPGMDTKEIYNRTFKCLQEEVPVLAARYSLKRAIMELGPAGFLFEEYIAEILREYGYTVTVGKMVKGHCVNQEIDIIAKKGLKQSMVECKYHNSRGIFSDLKVSMYTWARFLDVKANFDSALLVTNTRCTKEAIDYARCVGLKIISWRYPKNESLEYLIENKKLYPITALPSLKRYHKEILSQKRILLAKDLLKYTPDSLMKYTGLKQDIVAELQSEARQLCS